MQTMILTQFFQVDSVEGVEDGEGAEENVREPDSALELPLSLFFGEYHSYSNEDN